MSKKDGLKIHLNAYLIQAFFISNKIITNETPRIPEIAAEETVRPITCKIPQTTNITAVKKVQYYKTTLHDLI